MGRKPKVAKVEEKPQLLGSRIVPERKEELPPEGAKSPPNGLQMQPANPNPSLEKVEPMAQSADPSLEKTTKPKRKASASLSTNKKSREEYGSVRRSGRLQNAVVPARIKDIGPVFQDITANDSENEDEPPLPEEGPLQKLSLSEMSLETKVNYLFKQLELPARFMEPSNSKVAGEFLPSGSASNADLKYKILHMDCDKKIEALQHENHVLTVKLENAVGKLEMYEQGNHIFSEVLDKLKQMVVLFNWTKPAETAAHGKQTARDGSFSPGAVGNASSPKRKACDGSFSPDAVGNAAYPKRKRPVDEAQKN
ncbi:uncharacterized protein LOC115756934 [Rhodamnia argentea]|uniref:Uncharacterized protein LOC115756934 n=1 Tax=Rhodamnia argentea TaxID=178133 RepID=A0A8B8QZZ2_9MYRT|nr:uncharacterized protein LOC115756934 [Rhodamnia argentea]